MRLHGAVAASAHRERAAAALMSAGLLTFAGSDRFLLTVPAELGTALEEERSVGEVIDA